MPDNPNLAILQQFVGAVFSGDADTIRSLCDPEFVLTQGHGRTYAGTYPGGEGFLRFLQVFNETFEIEAMETPRIYRTDDQDYLVTEMELRSTVRATGARYDTSLLERWQFRDGKVLSVKPHYFDAM